MNGQTRRSAAHRNGRPPIDPNARRYFVYFLRDDTGRPVYIGRSCDVAARIRAHHGTQQPWITGARSVDMVGPFAWREAVAEERRHIELNQPRGNRALTSRDHRSAVARRSASRDES